MIYRKGVGNIDWRGDWKHKRAVDFGSGQERHSCVNGSDNVWVLWEVAGFLSMHVLNAQVGYIVGKSLNHQQFKKFCSFQEEWGRHYKCLMSSFILDNCCWRTTGLVSKGAVYWVWGVFIASFRLCISICS